MKRFKLLHAGTVANTLVLNVEEHLALKVERITKHVSYHYQDKWYIGFEAYLAYKDVTPEDIAYDVKYRPGSDDSDAVCLTYRGMCYSQIRALKTIFGEDNFYLEGNYNGCGHIDVYYKIQYEI